MMRETLRDTANNVIGYIDTDDDGNQTLTSPDGVVKGTYEADADHTRDENSNIVAKGNVLRAMIC